MANLSNINNILRTGSLGVGINRDPLGAFEISSATKPGIKMFNTAANGKTYEAYSDVNGNYIIYDQDADNNRLTIDSSGNATFAGNVTTPQINLNSAGGGIIDNQTGNIFIQTPSGTGWIFRNGPSGYDEKMRIDSSGNVGIGVTPSTIWSSSYNALQIGLGGSVYAHSSAGSSLNLGANIVYEGTAPNYYDKYLTSSTATKYEQDAGVHIWSTAVSGTAGNAVSWSERMRITNAGNVGIGTDLPTARLMVKDSSDSGFDSGIAIIRSANSQTGYINMVGGAMNFNSPSIPIIFRQAGSGKCILTSGGEVGIGITPKSWTLFNPIQIGQSSSFVGRTALNQTDVANNWYYNGDSRRITTGYAQRYIQNHSGEHVWYTAGIDSADSILVMSERLRITNGGQVQVGYYNTARGGANTTFMTGKSGTTYLELNGGDTNGEGGILFADGSGGNYGLINYSHVSDIMQFYTASAERMRIDSSGNVGIGQLPYSYSRLSTEGSDNTSSNYAFIAYNQNTDAILACRNDGQVTMPTGNVGIGLTAPVQKLNLSGHFGFTAGTAPTDFTADIKRYGIGWQASSGGGNLSAFINSEQVGAWGGDLNFYTRGAGSGSLILGMRITSGGDVLIGTQTVTSVSKLQLTSSNAYYGFVDRAQVSGSGAPAGFFNSAGSLVGHISTNNSSTTYFTSSDYRLKENVVKMTGALDRVSQLKPSRFNFIADADKTVDGFLAHEVQEIVPEAISGEKDAVDEEGNPEYQGIDQSKLVPLLVGAIQELKADNDSLKARIETLENN